MNSVPQYAKSYATLRIDKSDTFFCKSSFTKSYLTLHYIVYVSMNSVPRYAKSYATLKIDKSDMFFVSPTLQNLI